MLSMLMNMSIRNKIILMLVFPIAGLAYFAFDGIMGRQDTSSEMTRVESLAELARKSSALVHETQKERGMTAGYIGSGGEKFATQLPAQRSSTDQQIAELKTFIDGTDVSEFGREVSGQLGAALRDLDALSAHRQSVTSISISATEAIGFYTRLNSRLLDMVGELAKATRQGEITRQITAYYNFLQSKERAGIERAVLANTFAADQFGEGMFRKFSALVAAQETYTNAFLAFADDAAKKTYQQKMQGGFVAETERMRETAFDKAGTGDFGVDPGFWFDQQTGKINLLKEIENDLSEGLVATATALRSAAQGELVFFAILAAVAAGLALSLAVFMTRGIVNPIREALGALHDIAEGEGDLTRRLNVKGKDEIAELAAAFNRFADKIHDLVARIKSAAETIKGSSSEIAEGNSSLSQRTEEQASSLEETASSMEEMTGTVKQNADSASQANQLASSSREQAEKGGEVVGKAVNAMDEINASSKKIADIISVIDEIAFQTNLLALNASVEAARAGEQGRGFAVVASEVRNLAQRSAGAAKEIKELIQDSVGKVEQGSSLVNGSGETLGEIITGVKKVTDIVSEIAAASQEQSAGIDQVNKAVMQMDEMTQQNAAMVEQVAAASRSMEEQADLLGNLVGQFKVAEDAGMGGDERAQRVIERQTTSRSSQGAPARDRRGANRPWSNNGKEGGQAQPKSAPPAGSAEASPAMGKTGTDDNEWEEF